MKAPKIVKKAQAGFTLIELMIVGQGGAPAPFEKGQAAACPFLFGGATSDDGFFSKMAQGLHVKTTRGKGKSPSNHPKRRIPAGEKP